MLALSMAQDEDKHSLEAKFAAAVKVVQSLPEEGDNLFCLFFLYPSLWMKDLRVELLSVDTWGDWPTCRTFVTVDWPSTDKSP